LWVLQDKTLEDIHNVSLFVQLEEKVQLPSNPALTIKELQHALFQRIPRNHISDGSKNPILLF